MSFALLRSGAIRFSALYFTQPRCALQLKSKGVQYYWLDHPYDTLHEPSSIFDRTQYRLNDNSRSICVEGNVAVGKGTLARNLAETLYLKYVPAVSDDDFFVDKNYEPPLDYRDYNKVLPKNLQFYTTEMLFTDSDPIHHGMPLYAQQNFYMYRCYNYWKGCGHIFNTGQGFVMNRSPFSAFVFAKAMAECGLMSAEAKDWFLYYEKHVDSVMMYPHLVVYIRSPVSLSRANLAKRGVPWQSKIPDKFLETVKQLYESEFLPKISRFSEVYTLDAEDYNFNDSNDVAFLAEELCKFDLDQKHLSTDVDTKLIHWRLATFNGDSKASHRAQYSSAKPLMTRLLGIQVPDDMPEGGLKLHESGQVRDLLKRDPRQRAWSLMNPWDMKSTIDVVLGNTRLDPTREEWYFDEDALKVMAYTRNFGYYKRLIEPKYHKH